MRQRIVGIVTAIALMMACGSVQASETKLEEALSFFSEAALWNASGAEPATPRSGIVRWNTPIRAFFQSSTTSSVRRDAMEALKELSDISGHPLEIVESPEKANMVMEFLQDYQRPAGVQSAGCMTRYGTPIIVSIRLNQSSCIRHEYLHAYGFRSHPHEFNSVLSYTRQASTRLNLTDIDVLALRALYRGKVTSGMYHLPALVAARQYMAEELGLVGSGADTSRLAVGVLDKVLDRLKTEATKGNPSIQSQLGNAYAYGHYIAVDLTEAHRWWEQAAEKKNSEAFFQLGRSAQTGRGIPADPGAARIRFSEAAVLKHGLAAFELGKMLRDGVGGPVEPVEAYAHFDLAARREIRGAAEARAALEPGMSEDQRARAQARGAELAK